MIDENINFCLEKINKLKQKIKRNELKLKEYEKTLKKICTHEKTYIKKSYFNGSYYDLAHTTYYCYCFFCNKLIKKWTVQHSWYG